MKQYKNKCLDGIHPRVIVTEDFVESNNLSLLRSEDEILYEIIRTNDELDCLNFKFFRIQVLLQYISWEKSKSFIFKNYQENYSLMEREWIQITDVYECVQDFLDYMVFAWSKTMAERGLSASKSMEKLSAWLWLLGRNDLCDIIRDDLKYYPYGGPILIEVCEKLNILVPQDLRDFVENYNKEK